MFRVELFLKNSYLKTSLISPCYPYRHQTQDETELEYGLRVANELEEEIINLGPENVMAFVAETVGGATAGALTPVIGYFKRIREICNKYNILLILDEVMCGMGRTGSLFACEDEEIIPDILTVAKGLGAGYQPIGAMICQNFIYDAWLYLWLHKQLLEPRKNPLSHHPEAFYIALEVRRMNPD